MSDPNQPKSRVADAFTGPIEQVRPTLMYRVGLGVVTLVMLFLPLVYLGLIAAVCYGVYYHATHHLVMFDGVTGRGMIWMGIFYAAPIAAGALIVFLMLKPIFARQKRETSPFALEPSQEPKLFEYVHRIADAVGAPRPTRIEVDSDVNASASFRRGWRSLFSNDLMLTIGTPLVAGMTARQLAGVIAHEFGHFSQGGGMRLTYIIRRVNSWFARVVHERDAWDDRIAGFASEAQVIWITVFVWFCQACIYLTRLILRVFHILGEAISCAMLRQMEFDADRYEARLSGSAEFAGTVQRLNELQVGWMMTRETLPAAHAENRLPDNLPRLIAHRANDLDEGLRKKISKHIADSKTSLFATHPSDRERIRSAEREQAPGVFVLDAPATALFDDFDAIARWTTMGFYKAVDPSIADEHIASTEEVVRTARTAQKAEKAAVAFFGVVLTGDSLFFHDETPAPDASDDALVAELLASRSHVTATYAAAAKGVAALRDVFEDRAKARRWEIRAAASRATSSLGKKADRQMERATEASAGLDDRERMARGAVEAHMAAQMTRIRIATELLSREDFPGRPEKAAGMAAHARALLETLHGLHETSGALEQCGEQTLMLVGLFEIASEASDDQGKFRDMVLKRVSRLHADLADLLRRLRAYPYPLKHNRASFTVGEFILEALPGADDPNGVMHAAFAVQSGFRDLYVQVLSRLSAITMSLEHAAGLSSLTMAPTSGADDPDLARTG